MVDNMVTRGKGGRDVASCRKAVLVGYASLYAVAGGCPCQALNGLSEVGTILSAVSRDQPGHLESWADPPTQPEPSRTREGDHASKRPRWTTRNSRICMVWHETVGGVHSTAWCDVASQREEGGGEGEHLPLEARDSDSGPTDRPSSSFLTEKPKGAKAKPRAAIKCANHITTGKAIRTRADHAGGDRTGASPGSPVGEGRSPGPNCLLSRRASAPKWRESRVVDRCGTNKSGAHRRLT